MTEKKEKALKCVLGQVASGLMTADMAVEIIYGIVLDEAPSVACPIPQVPVWPYPVWPYRLEPGVVTVTCDVDSEGEPRSTRKDGL